MYSKTGGVFVHSYLRSIGFSKITKRKEMQELIREVIDSYDEKYVVENHPDGAFAEFSKNYGRNFRKITLKKCVRSLNMFWEGFIYKGFRKRQS